MQRDPTGKIFVPLGDAVSRAFNKILANVIAAERLKPLTIVIEQVQFQAAVVQELLARRR